MATLKPFCIPARCCVVWLMVSAAADAQETTESPAAEKAAQRIAALLQPGGQPGQPFARGPVARQPIWWIEHPTVPIPSVPALPVRITPVPVSVSKLRHPPGETPLLSFRKDPRAPTTIELPAGYLVRLPAADVNQPLPLPILALPLRDRASLADPTYDSSVLAALAQVQALRLLQVPFVPLNLPDPFEHSQAIRLRFLLDEDPAPAPVMPRAPSK